MVRSRGKYDICFETDDRILGYQLAEPPTKHELNPARLDEQARHADVPRIYETLDAGMGYSRRIENVPNGYAFTLPGYCRAPGGIFMPSGKLTPIALPPTSGGGSWVPSPLVGSKRFDGRIWVFSTGPYVLLVQPDGASMIVAQTLPGNIAGFAVFNNRIYVSTSAGLVYHDSEGGWSAPSAGVIRGAMAVTNWRPLGVPTDVLVAIAPDYRVNAVRWCPITADPMVDTNWSAPVRIGADMQYGTHAVVAAPRHVYFTRPDGCYDMDELGVRSFNIAPWVAESPDHYNGVWGMAVGDGIYYGHSQGLAFIPTTGEAQYRPEWATPGWGLPYEGPIRGYPVAGCLHQGWGLLAQWSPELPQSYISAGRRDPGGSAGRMAYGHASHVWHGAEAVVNGAVTHIQPHALSWTGGRADLLITTQDGSGGIAAYWQSLPRWGTPLQELLWSSGFVPADAASLFLPADPWDRPSSTKTLLQMDMVTERLDPTSDTLKGYARADEETAWADYGTAETGSYTGLAPLETTEGRYISVRVDAIGSPVLRSLELRSAIGVELREARSYTVILAWDNALKGARGRETADPERRLDDLRSLLGRVCTLDDGSADGTRRVRVLQVQAGERRPMGGAARAGAAGTVGAWAITAQVMVSVLDRPFRWSGPADTDRFDADRVWL